MLRVSAANRLALAQIAAAPFEAHYDNGVTQYGSRLVGVSHDGVSVRAADALARHGWISKRKRLPRFGEGTLVVYVYEITALGRSLLA